MRKTRLDRSKLLELVDLTYAVAEDGQRWEPLLASIATAVGGVGACVLSYDFITSSAATVLRGFDPEALRLANEQHGEVEAWALAPDAPWRSNSSRAISDPDLRSPGTFEKTRFHPFVRRFGDSRVMHATLHVDARRGTGIGVYRSETSPPFGDREQQFLEALTPHLRRGLRMHQLFVRAGHDKQAALDCLDAVSCGVMLVSGEGRVIHANRAAAAILKRHDGLFLDQSCLTAASSTVTSSIRRLCMNCARTTHGESTPASGALAVPQPSGRRNLQLLVSPVRRTEHLGWPHDQVTAVVFVTDPADGVQPDRALLQIYYGLTPTEADVAARLGAGESLDEIAAARRYTKQTTQWYSKQILSKVGCRNRAALARELSNTLRAVELFY
jgi:DNA-binding CsgD family transcriptional regulator